jgi:hypothetical protein
MCQSCCLSLTSLFGYLIESLPLGPPAAGHQDLPDLICSESFPGCLVLYPGGSGGAFTRFFPPVFGLPYVRLGRLSLPLPVRRLRHGTLFRGCRHFLMFRPPGLLATQVAPTDNALRRYGSRGVYFRAPWSSLPCSTSDMLAVRIGQLTAGDLHPIRFAALSAASPNTEFTRPRVDTS